LSKPKSYSTKLIFNELGAQNFDKIFYTNVLLLLYKHISIYQLHNVKHDYNTRYKHNINIVPNYCNTTFDAHCFLNVGSNLCKKLNINLFNFKSVTELKFFLYNLNFVII